jgi:hypothetical protein
MYFVTKGKVGVFADIGASQYMEHQNEEGIADDDSSRCASSRRSNYIT